MCYLILRQPGSLSILIEGYQEFGSIRNTKALGHFDVSYPSFPPKNTIVSTNILSWLGRHGGPGDTSVTNTQTFKVRISVVDLYLG